MDKIGSARLLALIYEHIHFHCSSVIWKDFLTKVIAPALAPV